MSTTKTLASIAAPAAPVQTVVQPETKKQNPKEKARIESGLKESRVESVRVDGLTLMKIIKHSHTSHTVNPAPSGTSNATVSFSPAVGQLLGIDSEGVLEVSNCFALPSGSLGGIGGSGEDGGEKGLKAANKYTTSLLPRLSDLNSDASLIGFYVSSNNGQTLATSGFIEALLASQLSGGGIGSGTKITPVSRGKAAKEGEKGGKEGAKYGKGIALVYDTASAGQGNVGLKAFRLSEEFMEASKDGKYDTASLIEHKLVPSTILEEVPVTIHSSSLLTAFLSTLVTPSSSSSRNTPLSPLSSFSSLSLPTSSSSSPSPLSTPLTALLSSLDTHQAHLSTLSFQSRQLARDRARLESSPAGQKRKAENEQRAKEGLPPLPQTEEEKQLTEPSRLETMCALAGVQGAALSLSEATGAQVVRSFGSKAGTVV